MHAHTLFGCIFCIILFEQEKSHMYSLIGFFLHSIRICCSMSSIFNFSLVFALQFCPNRIPFASYFRWIYSRRHRQCLRLVIVPDGIKCLTDFLPRTHRPLFLSNFLFLQLIRLNFDVALGFIFTLPVECETNTKTWTKNEKGKEERTRSWMTTSREKALRAFCQIQCSSRGAYKLMACLIPFTKNTHKFGKYRKNGIKTSECHSTVNKSGNGVKHTLSRL